jgi:hypothetical protein
MVVSFVEGVAANWRGRNRMRPSKPRFSQQGVVPYHAGIASNSIKKTLFLQKMRGAGKQNLFPFQERKSMFGQHQ